MRRKLQASSEVDIPTWNFFTLGGLLLNLCASYRGFEPGSAEGQLLGWPSVFSVAGVTLFAI